jgi:hypothetical protein
MDIDISSIGVLFVVEKSYSESGNRKLSGRFQNNRVYLLAHVLHVLALIR